MASNDDFSQRDVPPRVPEDIHSGRRRALASAPRGCSVRRRRRLSTIGFQGWAFEPQVVEASVKRFMAENPDIKVGLHAARSAALPEKMVALFNAGTQGDAFYVRDTHLGAWVEAGWMQPIDGMPELAELNKDIYPATLQTLLYKGKQYGVPYYGDIYLYLYDKAQLAKAGVKKVPVTLDELKNAALEVKKAGISQYPILKGYKTNTDGLDEFWSMVFASGGHLFNAAMDPVFPNEDKTAVMVLEWMLEAMHNWKILDPRGLEIDETQARDIYLSGQGTFTSAVGNVFPRANNPAAFEACRQHPDDEIPRRQGCQQGTDGLVAAVRDELEDEAQGGRVAPPVLHGRQGQGRHV